MGKERISGECPYCRASLATDRDDLGIQKRVDDNDISDDPFD